MVHARGVNPLAKAVMQKTYVAAVHESLHYCAWSDFGPRWSCSWRVRAGGALWSLSSCQLKARRRLARRLGGSDSSLTINSAHPLQRKFRFLHLLPSSITNHSKYREKVVEVWLTC